MPRPKKLKPNLPKLPVIEWAFRWIDVFTYFDHSEQVKNDAYSIIERSANDITTVHPSQLAVTAMYLSCEKNGIPFNIERINKILEVFLAHRKQRFGCEITHGGLSKLKSRAKAWKSRLESV